MQAHLSFSNPFNGIWILRCVGVVVKQDSRYSIPDARWGKSCSLNININLIFSSKKGLTFSAMRSIIPALRS